MEPKKSSTNGQLSPSTLDHLSGVLTRSKSQIHIHQSRSDQFRPNTVFQRNQHAEILRFESSRKRPRRELNQELSDNNDELLHILIKDLRGKRVFSPKVVDGCNTKPSEAARIEKFDLDLGRKDDTNGSPLEIKERKEDAKRSKNHEDGEILGDINCIVSSITNEYCRQADAANGVSQPETGEAVPNLDNLDIECSVTNGSVGLSDEAQRRDEVCVISKQIDELDEEWLRKTPPDAEIVSAKKSNTNRAKTLEASNGTSPKSNVCAGDGYFAKNDSRIGYISDTKLVLKPCFKRKLFKTPGSFSYKRLLPYLVGVTGGISEEKQCAKLEKNKEDSPKSNLDDFPREYQSVNSITSPESVLPSSSEISNGNPNLESPETITPSPIPSGTECSSKEQSSKPLVNEQAESFGSKAQLFSGSHHDFSLVVESASASTDEVIRTSSHDSEVIEDGETLKSDCQFRNEAHIWSCKNSNWSSQLNGYLPDKERGDSHLCVDAQQTGMAGMKKVNTGCSSKSQKVLSELEGNAKLCNVENICNDSLQFLNGEDKSIEEPFHLTPPDADIAGKAALEKNGGIAGPKKYNSSPMSKSGYNPRSRPKLFRSPGSFSYRRLLPFLMDLEKENSLNSSALGNGNCPKLEKDSASTLLPQSVSSALEETPIDKSTSCQISGKKNAGDSSTRLMYSAVNTLDISAKEEESNATSSLHISTLPVPLKENGQQLQSEQVVSDRNGLETSTNIVSSGTDRGITSLDPVDVCNSVFGDGMRLFPSQSIVDAKDDCTRLADNYKLPEANVLQLKFSQGEGPVPSVNPVSFRKGILKRNPRGCRGPCTCLNCSSFRLHAERAFEFSRNQLQDAEELAFDLIKELACLRNMLEKSANGANDESGIHINLVNEACSKASEAEAIAKGRLSQLNYELSIHCRMECSQRPNVRFARNVEEKLIQDQELARK